MKKLLYTLALVLMTSIVKADQRSSDLHIQMFNGAPIKVFVDGRLVSYQPQSLVCVTDLIPGRHMVRIVAPRSYNTGYERTLFQGPVFIDPSSEIHGEVDRYGRFRVTRIIQRQFLGYGLSGGHNSYGDRGYGDHMDYGSTCCGSPSGYGRAVIRDSEFRDIREQLRTAPFESTKLTIAKRAVSSRWISAVQCKGIMECFAFESTKVEFAKFAYGMVADKERFYIVYDAFTFSSSIDELDDFVARQGY